MLIMECGDTNPLFNRISHLITETSLSIKTSFSHIYIPILKKITNLADKR